MRRALAIVAFVTGCSAGDDIPPPAVSALSPPHAPAGTSVMVLGNYFCQQLETGGEVDPLQCDHIGTVTFGTAPGAVGTYADHMITVEVPSLAAGRVAVSVTVAGRVSNRVDFDVD